MHIYRHAWSGIVNHINYSCMLASTVYSHRHAWSGIVNHINYSCMLASTVYSHRHAWSGIVNPLTTEFFPPRQHIFMHSAHTTFVGTPLPQHTLLSGQTWWGPHTWRDPSGNTVNDIHDPPQGQQSEVKCGCQPDFRPAFP